MKHAFGTKYVQNCYFSGKCSGNCHFKMHLTPNMYKIDYFEGKCPENHYFKMYVAPHMCKTFTLKANAKKIITKTCIWHQICTKSLL